MEIILEVYESHAERAAQILCEEMAAAFKYYAPDVLMPVKADIGDYWIH